MFFAHILLPSDDDELISTQGGERRFVDKDLFKLAE
jgi:hypothetical protein